MDWAQNMTMDLQMTERLDNLERQVLASGRMAQSRQNRWLSCGVGGIVAAELVINHRKRKLSALRWLFLVTS